MTAEILKKGLIDENAYETAKAIIEYILANTAINVPINKTGTGYIDYINDRKARPKKPILPIPIKIIRKIC